MLAPPQRIPRSSGRQVLQFQSYTGCLLLRNHPLSRTLAMSVSVSILHWMLAPPQQGVLCRPVWIDHVSILHRMLAPPQLAVPRTAWGTGQMGFLRGRCKMTFICCLHEPLSLLYKKMDFCARACEAAWAIWL